MIELRIARCVGNSCMQKISCLHHRAVEIDESMKPIDPKARRKTGAGCDDYLQILPGVPLKPWRKA